MFLEKCHLHQCYLDVSTGKHKKNTYTSKQNDNLNLFYLLFKSGMRVIEALVIMIILSLLSLPLLLSLLFAVCIRNNNSSNTTNESVFVESLLITTRLYHDITIVFQLVTSSSFVRLILTLLTLNLKTNPWKCCLTLNSRLKVCGANNKVGDSQCKLASANVKTSTSFSEHTRVSTEGVEALSSLAVGGVDVTVSGSGADQDGAAALGALHEGQVPDGAVMHAELQVGTCSRGHTEAGGWSATLFNCSFPILDSRWQTELETACYKYKIQSCSSYQYISI